MSQSNIRLLAAARHEHFVAAGESNKHVSVWDVARRSSIGEFETVLDYGGRRLALSNSGDCCYAAAYHALGIASYNVIDGSLMWRRPDLRRAQILNPSRDGRSLHCSMEGSAFLVLDAATGEETGRHRGVRQVHESECGPFVVVEKTDLQLRDANWRKVGSIERASFATLAVAFSPEVIAISESGAGVRFIRIPDLVQLACYYPPAGHHVLDITYAQQKGRFVGVEWHYQIGGAKRLLQFSAPGTAEVLALLGGPADTTFVNGGAEVLTSDGVLFSTSSGETIATLDFAA